MNPFKWIVALCASCLLATLILARKANFIDDNTSATLLGLLGFVTGVLSLAGHRDHGKNTREGDCQE